eukprot:jgi/Mesvir1/21179/Mv08644-RA.2
MYAIWLLADAASESYEQLQRRLMHLGRPACSGTTPRPIRLNDDKSLYTGLQWRRATGFNEEAASMLTATTQGFQNRLRDAGTDPRTAWGDPDDVAASWSAVRNHHRRRWDLSGNNNNNNNSNSDNNKGAMGGGVGPRASQRQLFVDDPVGDGSGGRAPQWPDQGGSGPGGEAGPAAANLTVPVPFSPHIMLSERDFRAMEAQAAREQTLRQYLLFYDRDRNGFADEADLADVLADLGALDHVPAASCPAYVADMFRRADRDGDGRLSHSEFAALLTSLPSYQHRKECSLADQEMAASLEYLHRHQNKFRKLFRAHTTGRGGDATASQGGGQPSHPSTRTVPGNRGSKAQAKGHPKVKVKAMTGGSGMDRYSFLGLLRSKGLIDKQLTIEVADIIFSKARGPRNSRLPIDRFVAALLWCARARQQSFLSFADALLGRTLMHDDCQGHGPPDASTGGLGSTDSGSMVAMSGHVSRPSHDRASRGPRPTPLFPHRGTQASAGTSSIKVPPAGTPPLGALSAGKDTTSKADARIQQQQSYDAFEAQWAATLAASQDSGAPNSGPKEANDERLWEVFSELCYQAASGQDGNGLESDYPVMDFAAFSELCLSLFGLGTDAMSAQRVALVFDRVKPRDQDCIIYSEFLYALWLLAERQHVPFAAFKSALLRIPVGGPNGHGHKLRLTTQSFAFNEAATAMRITVKSALSVVSNASSTKVKLG